MFAEKSAALFVTVAVGLLLYVVNGSRSASFLSTYFTRQLTMITQLKSALASTACALPIVFGTLTTNGLAQGSTQVSPGGSAAVARPISLTGKYTPDADQYGSASGQVASPSSYVQMFGFPMRCETIELQLRDARPGSLATFYISDSHNDEVVPNLGRVLVDLNSATTQMATVDSQGNASVSITIASNTPFGTESYVQCITSDAAQVLELSKAVYFEVGQIPIVHMMANVDGAMTVTSQYGTSSPGASGTYNYEWEPAGNVGKVDGFMSLATEAGLSTPVGFIPDLTVQSTGEGPGIVWDATNFLEMPNGIVDEFWVSYTHQGTEYGPYTVSALTTVDAMDIDTQLSALPTGDGGPLDGATITLDLSKVCLQPAHFDEIDGLGTSGLASGPGGGAGITGMDVEAEFDRAEFLMGRALLPLSGYADFFEPEMPSYAQFVSLEGVQLMVLTNGQASTIQQMRANNEGVLAVGDDKNVFLAKLYAAIGINESLKDFKETFDEVCGDDWKKFKKHADNGKWRKAGKALKRILKKLPGKAFTSKLASRIGKKKAAKIVAKIASKCVPFLGWGIVAGSLLWAYVEQIWE